ncbi:MAG: prolyl oligopeptidase family serine peptidase [Xanthomonadales bacterium]|nr:prolyl oligopeptidase family serine peptidase [Xanthomonadales bacterium]
MRPDPFTKTSWQARLCAGLLLLAPAAFAPALYALDTERDALLEKLSAPPAAAHARLSPDGRFLALVRGGAHRDSLLVQALDETTRFDIDLPARTRINTVAWLGEQRLLLGLERAGEGAWFAAVERNGRAWRRLTPAGRDARHHPDPVLVDLLPRDPVHVLVAMDRERRRAPDVVRVNVYTGEHALVAENPGQVYLWMTDPAGAVRLRSEWAAGEFGVSYRHLLRRPGDDWRPVYAHLLGGRVVQPLAFAADGRRLLVAAEGADDSLDLMHFDPRTGQAGDPVLEVAGVDLQRFRVSGRSGQPAWAEIPAWKPGAAVLVDEWSGPMEALAARLPDTHNRIESMAANGRRSVVLSYSDQDPGRYWLADGDAPLRELAPRMPGVHAAAMSAVQPFRFTTRDGLALEGYWTAPRGTGRKLPTVLYVHGGPWARDHWGFDPMVQWLSAHGFGVLQVNFRGSRGFGRGLMMAGRGGWGGAMQDDLVDAVAWAARRGLVDKDRVCIMGASYGGYAALMGVLRDPGMFRCAVALAPVTDPAAQIEGYRDHGNARAAAEWTWMVGRPETLEGVTPLARAGSLRRPVLLLHGTRDAVVDVAQSRAFAEAAGGRAQLLELPGSGHEPRDAEHRRQWFAATAAFLERQLQPAAESPGS